MEAKQAGRRAKRQFTDEFKAGAVRLVLDEGKTVAQAARDLGLTASSLRVWVERARADRTGGKTGLTTEERAEMAALRKEVRTLRMERDILKQAAVRSNGARNTRMVHGLDGATWTPWPIGSAEEGALVEIATRAVAQRHRPCSREACCVDLRRERERAL